MWAGDSKGCGALSPFLGVLFLPHRSTPTANPYSGRRPKMSALLFKLLLHPLMQRETSEILLSHGSKHAWQALVIERG